MKLQKTATEKKQEALMRSLRRKKPKPKYKPKKAKKSKTGIEGIKELRTLSYPEFLASKYWAVVRKIILRRDKYCCVICKSTTRLEVHHDTYKNHFNELKHLEDLMTLCHSCHEEHHFSPMPC